MPSTSQGTGWTVYSYEIIECPDGFSETGTETTNVNTTGYTYPGTEYTNPYNGGGGEGTSTGGSTGEEPGGFCPDMSCDPNVTVPTVDPSIETATQAEKVQVLDDLLNLDSYEEAFLSQSSKEALLTSLIYLIHINGEKSKAKSFAHGVITVEMVLDDTNTSVSTTGRYVSEIEACCPGDCCPDSFYYSSNDHVIMTQLGVDMVNSAIDGYFNILMWEAEVFTSDAWMGSIVRKVLDKVGYVVPSDITDESLGQLLKIRKRDRTITLEYNDGIVSDLVDLAMNTADFLVVISPSKGGGAFLAINGGDKVTNAALKTFLSEMRAYRYNLSGPMLGKKIGHTFEVHGSHTQVLREVIAKNSNKNRSVWLNDLEAESFIARHLSQLSNGTRDIPLPTNKQYLGRVYRAGDGQIFPATHIRLVPSGNGVKTAFPINSSIDNLGTLGNYIPE